MPKKRSLFSQIFGRENGTTFGTELKMLNGYQATFTNFNGRLYETDQVRVCIDAIARNGAKLSPKHIRAKTREFKNLNGSIQRLISEQPNEIDNAYSFYYKVISQLYLDNNAFIFIHTNSLSIKGKYTSSSNSVEEVSTPPDSRMMSST